MSSTKLFPEVVTARDIFEVRKKNINSALELARKTYPSKSLDIWFKREYGWVLYEHIKLNLYNKNYQQAEEYYKEFIQLEIPNSKEDELLYSKVENLYQKIRYFLGIENSSEILNKLKNEIQEEFKKESIINNENILLRIIDYLFYSNKEKKYNIEFINQLFLYYKDLNPNKPSKIHSSFYFQMHEIIKNDIKGINYNLLAEIFNPPDDILPEEFQEQIKKGKRVTPFAEIYLYFYLKVLLKINNVDVIRVFLQKMDNLIIKYPKYIWLSYYKCKLLIKISSDKNEVLKSIISFVKLKPKEFWTWSLLGDQLQNEPEKAISCYCKAISLSNQDKYLVKVRQNLAKLLIDLKKYSEAKYEIDNIIRIKKANNQVLPSELNSWIKSAWYKEIKPTSSNNILYNKNLKVAENIVYGNSIIIKVGVITNIDKNTGKVYYGIDKNISGEFKSKKDLSIKVGDIFEFKLILSEKNSEKKYEVLEYRKTKELPSLEVYREFEGIIKLSKSKEIGFIDSILVTKNLIESNNLHNNNNVKGIAIYSFNKKKNEFGWKAIKIWKNK